MLILTPMSVAVLTRKGALPTPALLDFNFLTTESLDPQISFSRTTNGTRFNSSGLLVTESPNVPRFDYDPATLDALGLLVEPQRTNRVVQSDNVSLWAQFGRATTATAAGLNSFGDIATSVTGTDVATRLRSVANGIVGTPFVLSVLMSAGTASSALISVWDGADYAWIGVDFVTGVSQQIAGALPVSITTAAIPDGLIVTISYTDSSASTTDDMHIGLQQSITGSIKYRNVQLEVGTFPTSYIPTTSATVTRTADVPQITLQQPADILVQDREGGAWIAGIPAGPYTMAPRTDKRHIARWRAFPAGYAASHPELAVAYP